MKITTNQILIFFGIVTFAIMACLPITLFAMPLMGPSQPSQLDYASTLEVVVAQTMVAAPSPTPTLYIPTSTSAAPMKTPVPTAVSYCDWASFVTDVTIPDGTLINPSEVFTKTWRLKNVGTCTWTPEYDVVFYGGAQMSGVTMQIPGYVAPGQSVDVAVTFTAPSSITRATGCCVTRMVAYSVQERMRTKPST
jgi:hypothetical protein